MGRPGVTGRSSTPAEPASPRRAEPIGCGTVLGHAENARSQTTREDRVVENGWYESVSLSDYVGVVWRRKWIALLVTVMVTAAAIGFSERQQKLFAATSQLVNTTSTTSSAVAKNSSGNSWSTSYTPLLDTVRAANFVVKRSGLTGITGAELLAETTIAADPNVDAIDFTVSDTNPLTAQKLATAWARETQPVLEPAEQDRAQGHDRAGDEVARPLQRDHHEEHRPSRQRAARDADAREGAGGRPHGHDREEDDDAAELGPPAREPRAPSPRTRPSPRRRETPPSASCSA